MLEVLRSLFCHWSDYFQRVSIIMFRNDSEVQKRREAVAFSRPR